MKIKNKNFGSLFIDQWEIVEFPHYLLGRNIILCLAAKHGCPVKGLLYPEPVPGVRYTITHCPDGKIQLCWESEK
jgi:hypothetical protein